MNERRVWDRTQRVDPDVRRYRPHRPLPDRPPISRPLGRQSERAASREHGSQPREGALGLVIVALLWSALLFAWGGADPTLRVLGILATFALPPAAVVALWWEDWPGSKLRPRWSGFLDVVVIAACGLLLAVLGQALEQRLDPAAWFVADPGPGHAAIFPALLPLGAATFTAMLQLTLVTEGWPLRHLGRVKGGAIALVVSWAAGLLIERLLVGMRAVAPTDFAACLACVSTLQVLGWVVLRGSPLARIDRRWLRLSVGNAATVVGGTALFLLIRLVVGDGVVVAGIAAGGIGAGLVFGMLFEGWPSNTLPASLGRAVAVGATVALGAAGVAGCVALAAAWQFPPAEIWGWTAYALNSLATAVIVHVGVFRRWPLPPAVASV